MLRSVTAFRRRSFPLRQVLALLAILLSALISTHAGRAFAAPQLDTGFGVDGFATLATAIDRIESMLVEPDGSIVATSRWDLVRVRRRLPDGAPDLSFGAAGESGVTGIPCTGAVRTARQPDGALVVVEGKGNAVHGCVSNAPNAFRFDASGALDPAFAPTLTQTFMAQPQIGLAARPDGRILYATTVFLPPGAGPAFVARVEQKTIDGATDSAYGVSGVADVDLGTSDSSGATDLALLADGSVVTASLLYSSLRIALVKVDAAGRPATAFGTGGVVRTANAYPFDGTSPAAPLTLLALADGTNLVATRLRSDAAGVATFALLVTRASADGRILGETQLFGGAYAAADWRVVALPDASVIIGGTIRASAAAQPTAALARLLPDGSLDYGFGAAAAFAVQELLSIDAMAVDDAGRLLLAGRRDTGVALARFRLDASPPSVAAVEFYNTGLGHYFDTAGGTEIAMIEAGSAGPGWQRTGNDFRAYVPERGVPVGARPVCRFYGTPGRGPNSHFYTMDPDECRAVQNDPGWTLEGTAFYLIPPVAGECAGGTLPVFRAYNGRFAQNDSNHRYTPDTGIYAQMQALGWRPEGVVFCAPAQ